MGSNRKIYFPKLRLAEKVMAAGGVTRDDAVAGAITNLQAISAEGDLVMNGSIQRIEKLVKSSGSKVDAAMLKELLVQADQVITLAGTFGYDYLDRAARSMCDTIELLLAQKSSDLAPIAVHADALRLFAPKKGGPTGDAAEGVLAELARVLTHCRSKTA
ncbi:MAG TPA: hypothetical protein VJ798_10520 [Rhizomicrobium sp.]|nr:hypothetical protein [Rhizomicrobium sp.]